MRRIALLTDSRYLTPIPGDRYLENIFEEEALLVEHLDASSIMSERVDWADASIDWSRFDAAVFRTTWDYFDRVDEFRRWLDRVQHQTQLINPASLVRWNLDKRYLGDLQAQGVPIVPTRFVEPGATATLAEIAASQNWQDVVYKPAVGGAGRETYRCAPGTARASEHETRFRDLCNREAMLVQPLVSSVLSHGEVTVVVIDGHCTHAIRKTAKAGDFRVQDDHGGIVHQHLARPDELELAEQAFAACALRPVYGRADIVRGPKGEPWIGELEIIEPELWMRFHPDSAKRFARAIVANLR